MRDEKNKSKPGVLYKVFCIEIQTCLVLTLSLSMYADAQSMLVESLNGPVTKSEINAFKTYMQQKVPAPTIGDQNIWVYGTAGKAIEACGLMFYEYLEEPYILFILPSPKNNIHQFLIFRERAGV